MLKYAGLSAAAALVVLAGMAENTIALPLLSVGTLFLLLRSHNWWIKLIVLTFAAVIWGVTIAVSPPLVLAILLMGTWLDRVLAGILRQRVRILLASFLAALLIGILRSVVFSLPLATAGLLQCVALWITVKLSAFPKASMTVFTMPPQAIDHDNKGT